MKKNTINLHANKKTTLTIVALFLLSVVLLSLIAATSIKEYTAQLISLEQSSYKYSVIMNSLDERDSYYQVDAGISFSTAKESTNSISATILMQGESTEYTELIYWNSEKLSQYGIAITKGLADKNNLKPGDKVYSKHVVDGIYYEYSVEYILPETVMPRVQERAALRSGIIIMGYDTRYIENISHNALLFTSRSFTDLSSNQADPPHDIIYREDEIADVIKDILPYGIVYIILAIVEAVLFAILLHKTIVCNYKRLIAIGFRKTQLKTSYRRFVYSTGIVTAIIGFVIAALVLLSIGIIKSGIYAIAILAIIEIISLIIAGSILGKKCWR